MIDRNINEILNMFLSIRPFIYKNEDKLGENENIQKIIATDIINQLIFSKKLFKKNILIGEFLYEYFNIEISKSVLKSRTQICGKVTKYIFEVEDKDELIEILNSLYSILKKLKNQDDIFKNDIYDVIKGIKL